MHKSVIAAGALSLLASATPAAAAAENVGPAQIGAFGQLLTEATGTACDTAAGAAATADCKTAAVSLVALPSGKFLYFDGVEGWNSYRTAAVPEWGNSTANAKTRVLDLSGQTPKWTRPANNDGGANPRGNDQYNAYLPGPVHNNDNKANDGDLFCSDIGILPDGRVIVAGGTAWYQEPGIPGRPTYGVLELAGLHNTTIYDPRTNAWSQSGMMNFGRWYPAMVGQPDGSVLMFGGVRKLMKPIYASDPQNSGANERHVERFDPKTGTWTTLPDSANKSLPLYPRLHLLPDGNTVFNGAGQAFNPAGYAWDEATWNFTSVLDAHTNQWRNVGVNLINGMPLGFRGSGASVLLPLKAGDPVARILNVGGTVGVTPGSYLATASSSITEIDTAKNDAMTARSTGSMNAPRWFPSAVVLPTGSVFTVNGSDVDMDWAPGMEKAVTMTELYDPARLFQEDVRMLEAQQRAIAANPGHEFYNLNIDAGSMWVRRILQRLIDAESGTHLSAVPGRVAG